MSKNAIAKYMHTEKIGPVEMASRLGVSKGYVVLLRDGIKPISLSVARKLGRLTGKSWWTFVPKEEQGEAAA